MDAMLVSGVTLISALGDEIYVVTVYVPDISNKNTPLPP
jgi:hypothetical protein